MPGRKSTTVFHTYTRFLIAEIFLNPEPYVGNFVSFAAANQHDQLLLNSPRIGR